jgi:acyl carrier protein
MTNRDLYKQVFIQSFEIDPEKVDVEMLSYNSIAQWDSIAHMVLIMNLEETFAISIDAEDLIEFSSYEKGKEILKKYDVAVE